MQTEFLNESKALACVHCGLCLGSCPTYLETGNENLSPRGRIYLMRSLQKEGLESMDTVTESIDQCLGCRACETACPSGVEYGQLLETTRDFIEHTVKRPLMQRALRRWLIERIFPYPKRFQWAVQPAYWLKRHGLEKWIPKKWRGPLDLIPDSGDPVKLPAVSKTTRRPIKGRAALVSGCVMQVLFQRTNQSTIRLLNELGYDVVLPEDQVCCGALHAHGGQLNQAREQARLNIKAFEKTDADVIVINAAGCGSTLKEYDHLLAEDPVWADRSKEFKDKVRDLTELLSELDCVPNSLTRENKVVTYHDACHLAHAQGISVLPREIVKRFAGENYVELPESDVCCGSAGSYNLTQPDMAGRLQSRKTSHILSTPASIVVTTNPGCLLQIRAGLKKSGREDIEVLHIADYLTRVLDFQY